MKTTFRLGPAHWLFIMATLVALAGVGVIIVAPTLISHYVVEVRGPELQRCLGFTASEVSAPANASKEARVFAVTSVREDSPLVRSGLRSGDIPVGYQHGSAPGFYNDLEAAMHGEDVTLVVIAAADWPKGMAGRRTIRLAPLGVTC